MIRALTLSLVCLAAVPATAGAALVPQKSIAGVRLGMSEAQVRAALGEPSDVRRGRNDFGRFTELVYRRARVRVILQGRTEVTSVTTTSRRQRTSRNVGVGSSERTVRRRVRGVRCRTFLRFRDCVVGRELPGRTVTSFSIRRGKVVRVTLGIVID